MYLLVTYEAVSLHLAQPESAVPAPALSGLPGEHRPGSGAAPVHLVQHHVLQLLVIHRALVDVRLEKGMYLIYYLIVFDIDMYCIRGGK